MSDYDFENELTGWAEHVRDEAYECGELAARRREAQREFEAEVRHVYAEMGEEQAHWDALQANPLTATCSYDFAPVCSSGPDDDLPF